MTEREKARENLLQQLPTSVRDVLDDPAALDRVLAALPDQERLRVHQIIDQLTHLNKRFPSTEKADEPAALEDSEIQFPGPARGVGLLPESGFRTTGAVEIVPPPEVLSEAPHCDMAGVLYPVWFATNRQSVLEEDISSGFTGERDVPGRTHHGVARVYVPEAHAFASLGSPWWYRWLWLWADDRLKLRQLEPRQPDQFWTEIRSVLTDFENQGFDSRPPQVLLFVHGYNVSFANAVIGAAQLGCDLRVSCLTACFSWPSKGTVQGYPADEATVEASVPALADFIHGLLEQTGASRVHILAHSMGNRAVLRALERLVWQAPQRRLQLGQILLAAPDVDRDVFRLLAPNCLRATQLQTTMYASQRDNAVRLSRWLHDYPRAGFKPPPTVLRGMTTIDVTRVDLSLIGHGYYHKGGAVLEDMGRIIHFNAAPETRRLQSAEENGARYYVMN